ncbi:MAG TPA: cytochrome c oxidase subunit II [Gaiellaceae bacterium]|nr:cytochrome c oxidase subunit II [Gaiellaceae bacterium]
MRRLLPLSCVALLSLACAGAALAGNGGLAPPSPASPQASDIRDIYWLILGISIGIFLLVEVTLAVFIVRYRSRGRAREVEGPQIRGHTNLELAWTAGPVVILAVIAGFVFWKAASIKNAPAGIPRDTIGIEAHQFYWEFTYPNGAHSVNILRVPYRRQIKLVIASADVAHSWWAPSLAGKMDAIPGRVNRLSFRALKLGTFPARCAEFCGLQHTQMLAQVEVLPPDQYEEFVRQRLDQPGALARETFSGVCAKCHGLAGQGDIGPPIATSGLLSDSAAMTLLLRQGRGKMPPVGKTWDDTQLRATIAYLQKRFHAGGGSGS